MRILILGGTAEARALAGALTVLGHDVTSSQAGRTSAPLRPAGALRSGGFGGVAGLAAYLGDGGFARLVDATHPYAVRMAANAVLAAQRSGVPLVRLSRPAWREPPGAGWLHVADAVAAAAALPAGARVLLSVGHGGLESYLERDDCRFIVRSIEPPGEALPAHARALLSRPPHTLAAERALLQAEAITHLVAKNSGGAQTEAKLDAAQQLGVQVVMLARPPKPVAPEVASVAEAVAALRLE